ncbi:protein HRB1, putative [Entamoeba invadens IP1]|uniref:Protein HRB1, putative n=1 Tax=Entamoeba invadens IP1 TaxID=370355 RepID=A0A0A1TYJ9_ENTIV|nr:protein HRB1, putative [Entamoeba invadens IP1]ELP86596.1 protein HRB1, putative [Entamoeba invadens IP1]|eukprot:XP_004185942.1 protein HRB1, putative [Entamoeba invadens IP1]
MDHERRSRSSSRERGESWKRRDRFNKEKAEERHEESRDREEQNERNSILEQLERERRTVFVRGLTTEATDSEIISFFKSAGTVVTVKQIIDQITQHSRGFGYVEFQTIEEANKAINMSGKFFKEGIPLFVADSNSQQNRNVSTVAALPLESKTIRVRNLIKQLDLDDINQVFGVTGTIVKRELKRDGDFNCALIEFETIKQAKKAIELYDGRKFGNVKWEVFSVKENGSDCINEDDEKLLAQRTKEMMMQRLQGGGTVFDQENKEGRKALFVQNMFSLAKEKSGFEAELRDDVFEELKQYCRVKDVIVDIHHPKGVVYVVCETALDTQKAFSVLNLRWFNMRLIRAEYFPENKVPVIKN